MKKSIQITIIILLFLFILGGLKQSQASLYSGIDQEIDSLNIKIQNQKKKISELKHKREELQNNISKTRKESINLKNQLIILEDNIAQTELDIEDINLQIDTTNLEMKKLEIDVNNLNNKIEKEKDNISDLLQLIYKQNDVSTLESLLLNNSLSDFLNQIKYLENTNQKINASVEKLKKQKQELEEKQLLLKEKTEELAKLKDKLVEKKDALIYEKRNKTNLLQETRSSEKRYQQLLNQAKQDELKAQEEIKNAEYLIRKKMSEKEKNKLNSSNSTIAWPVPKNYVVCGFHDPDYPYRHIIGEHPAVDIRAAQGTTLRAAADGYVARVRFDPNSRRYAYIMLIHTNGLATVYGHVSAVYVKPGEYVQQGQVIGKTGGTPGTAGAGRFTTGPHLHFEVRKNGIPVNPLNYLP